MGLRDRLAMPAGAGGYEQAAIVGIILVIVGSTMSWINVTAEPAAAEQFDDIDAGTTTFTGLDVNFGEITLYLGIIAAIVLLVVLWRYRGPGRITGLLLMLVGLVSAGVAVVGVVLAGSVIGPAGDLEGVSVGPGLGIAVTILGAIVLLSGGILRLAAGPAELDSAEPAE